MQFQLPFKGTEAEGIARIDQLLAEHRGEIEKKATNVMTVWEGNVLTFSFTAEGKHIEGTVTVKDGMFDVYAKLPLMMRMFEGTIERMIQAEVAKLKL